MARQNRSFGLESELEKALNKEFFADSGSENDSSEDSSSSSDAEAQQANISETNLQERHPLPPTSSDNIRSS